MLAIAAECDHLRSKALHKLSHSGVVDTDTGGSAISRVRTSSDAAFLRGQDHVIARIEARIAAWTMLPVEFGEGLQVLRYQVCSRVSYVTNVCAASGMHLCLVHGHTLVCVCWRCLCMFMQGAAACLCEELP